MGWGAAAGTGTGTGVSIGGDAGSGSVKSGCSISKETSFLTFFLEDLLSLTSAFSILGSGSVLVSDFDSLLGLVSCLVSLGSALTSVLASALTSAFVSADLSVFASLSPLDFPSDLFSSI